MRDGLAWWTSANLNRWSQLRWPIWVKLSKYLSNSCHYPPKLPGKRAVFRHSEHQPVLRGLGRWQDLSDLCVWAHNGSCDTDLLPSTTTLKTNCKFDCKFDFKYLLVKKVPGSIPSWIPVEVSLSLQSLLELFTIEMGQLSLIHRHDNRRCTLVTVDVLARKPSAITCIVLVAVRERQHTETMGPTQCLTGIVCNDPWHHWILHYVIKTAVREAAGEFPTITTLIITVQEIRRKV